MKKKKILIVDDDLELSEEMAEMLNNEGYAADHISDVQGGRDLILRDGYDIFLLDFKIKTMTGIDLLKEIRAKHPQAVVFFISGKPGLAALLAKEGLAGEVKDIIEKPFSPRLLLEKIDKC